MGLLVPLLSPTSIASNPENRLKLGKNEDGSQDAYTKGEKGDALTQQEEDHGATKLGGIKNGGRKHKG